MKPKYIGMGVGAFLAVAVAIPATAVVTLGEERPASNPPAEEYAPASGLNPAAEESAEKAVEPGPVERVDELELEEGSVEVDEQFEDRNQPLMTKSGDAHDAAKGFVDGLAWALASDASAQDPQLVPEALGGALNAMDAQMIAGFVRDAGMEIDPEAGAYRILGYSGDEKNPDQVMVEVSIPMEVDGQTTMLVAGGVMVRSPQGWIPTSMRPRDASEGPAEIDRASDVVAEIESGEHGIGWMHLGEETQ